MSEQKRLLDKMFDARQQKRFEKNEAEHLAELKREHQLKRCGEILSTDNPSDDDVAELEQIMADHGMSYEDMERFLTERESALAVAVELKHFSSMKIAQATADLGIDRYHSERQWLHGKQCARLKRLTDHQKLIAGEVERVYGGWKFIRDAKKELPWLFADIELPRLDGSFEYRELVENYKRAYMGDLPGYVASRIHEAPDDAKLFEWEWKIRDDYEAELLKSHEAHIAPPPHANAPEAPAPDETPEDARSGVEEETAAASNAVASDALGDGQPSTPADASGVASAGADSHRTASGRRPRMLKHLDPRKAPEDLD